MLVKFTFSLSNEINKNTNWKKHILEHKQGSACEYKKNEIARQYVQSMQPMIASNFTNQLMPKIECCNITLFNNGSTIILALHL